EVHKNYHYKLKHTRSERNKALCRTNSVKAIAAKLWRLLRLASTESPKKPATRKSAGRKPAPASSARKPTMKKAVDQPTSPPTVDLEERREVVYLTPPDSAAAADIDLVEAERASIDPAADADRSPR